MSKTFRLDQEDISPIQRRLLAEATQSPSRLTRALLQLIDDDDIQSGSESLHPEWPSLFEAHKDRIRKATPSHIYNRIDEFFKQISPLEKAVHQLDPSSLRLCFLLGAGASKPAPSDIPIVKELLPELLERARRLDREDVTRIADYCERRRIDNIEDLLTAAQIANFSSRNPTVLGLVNYLLYRGEFDDEFESAGGRIGT